MTAEQFAYWMQGFAELNAEPPTAEQWQSIRDHLQRVFVRVTPPFAGVPSQSPGYLPNPARYVTGPATVTTC